MKQLLLLTFLALFCLARSAPASSSNDGRLALPSYDEDEEVATDDNLNLEDDDTETVITTKIPTTRSTFVFPTRSRPTTPVRRPWLSPRTTQTTTISDYELVTEDIDINNNDHGFSYFKNIAEFFKKLLADLKRFFQKLANNDIIRLIRQLFVGKNND